MPLLEAVDLTCGHVGSVLSGIDLAVEAGETVTLIGPNGSGKSTLLKTLAGLLSPLSGEVRMSGDPVASLRTREVARRVASVPQDEAAPFAFTVRQLVAMGRLARSNGLLDTPEDLEAAEGAMRRTGCAQLADRAANETSGGERQRALIARALVQDTSILLMDEPTAHLDAPHQAWMVKLIRELAAEERAVIVAIHDLNLASALAGRTILLSKGQIAMDAPTEEVLASEKLDTAFGTAFDRLKTPTGRWVVVPRLD